MATLFRGYWAPSGGIRPTHIGPNGEDLTPENHPDVLKRGITAMRTQHMKDYRKKNRLNRNGMTVQGPAAPIEQQRSQSISSNQGNYSLTKEQMQKRINDLQNQLGSLEHGTPKYRNIARIIKQLEYQMNHSYGQKYADDPYEFDDFDRLAMKSKNLKTIRPDWFDEDLMGAEQYFNNLY